MSVAKPVPASKSPSVSTESSPNYWAQKPDQLFLELRSHPSRAMMLVTLCVGLVALVLPYSPLAGILGFKPLAVTTLGLIFLIVILYFVSAELVKRWFYRRFSV